MKRIEHYRIMSDHYGLYIGQPLPDEQDTVLQIVDKSNRFCAIGFYDNDILCGHPIGFPIGAQLPTEGESEIERDRR